MKASAYSLLPLGALDRAGFDCGTEALNRYFARQVGQDLRRRIAACFVALSNETGTIAGYYTLSAAGVALSDVPLSEAAKLPLYPSVPVARVGRLAVDRRFQGQKIGTALIGDAVVRASTSDVAVFAVVVDAKDAAAEAFYRHHGFVSYGKERQMLIAPIKKLLGR